MWQIAFRILLHMLIALDTLEQEWALPHVFIIIFICWNTMIRWRSIRLALHLQKEDTWFDGEVTIASSHERHSRGAGLGRNCCFVHKVWSVMLLVSQNKICIVWNKLFTIHTIFVSWFSDRRPSLTLSVQHSVLVLQSLLVVLTRSSICFNIL